MLMCDFYAPNSDNCTDRRVEEETAQWVHVEFGGRIYLVPRS